MILIVDYGLGNIGSISNMLKRLGIPAVASRDPDQIAQAERLIIPGVGAFDEGMAQIDRLGLRMPLTYAAIERRVPALGICLGMQLMTRGSDEGQRRGLAFLAADTVSIAGRVNSARPVRIPHMGWSFVDPCVPHPVFDALPDEPRFYFAHSYTVLCERSSDVCAVAKYGDLVLTAVCACDNLVGVQFHPEKSHRFGMTLLRSFAAWRPAVLGNAHG